MLELLPAILAVVALFVAPQPKPAFVLPPPQLLTASRTPALAAPSTLPAPLISDDSAGIGAVALTPLPTSAEILEAKVAKYVDAAAERLDDRMAGALERIEGTDRQLLALKYYQRRRGNVDAAWTWDRRQIAQYRRTKEHRQAVAEIARIRAVFAEQNPGYELRVNTDVRPLETQIEIWNAFNSVERASEGLMKVAERALRDSQRWPDEPEADDLARFSSLVASTGVTAVPTVAVPGFSAHGQGRAFDFIVWKDGQIVAGAVASTARTVWDKPGWTKKLQTAITTVSKRFRGPLAAPYEPWHYEYRGKG